LAGQAVVLPQRSVGRSGQTKKDALYLVQQQRFVERMLEIAKGMDFKVGSRGWGYVMENEGIIDKSQIDACERLILDLRKRCLIPVNLCAEDDNRTAIGLEDMDEEGPRDFAEKWTGYVEKCPRLYNHTSFWDRQFQTVYLEVWVEKIDLRSLFEKPCA